MRQVASAAPMTTLPAPVRASNDCTSASCPLQLRARLFLRLPPSRRRKSRIRALLGDYVYRTSTKNGRLCASHSDGIEAATDLPTYRNRYAQYRLDPDLQRLHAEVPPLVTWDDHEVANDYADKWSERFDDPELFSCSARRPTTCYEHMPVRPILSHATGRYARLRPLRLRRPSRLVLSKNFPVLVGREFRPKSSI